MGLFLQLEVHLEGVNSEGISCQIMPWGSKGRHMHTANHVLPSLMLFLGHVLLTLTAQELYAHHPLNIY